MSTRSSIYHVAGTSESEGVHMYHDLLDYDGKHPLTTIYIFRAIFGNTRTVTENHFVFPPEQLAIHAYIEDLMKCLRTQADGGDSESARQLSEIYTIQAKVLKK